MNEKFIVLHLRGGTHRILFNLHEIRQVIELDEGCDIRAKDGIVWEIQESYNEIEGLIARIATIPDR